MRGNRLIVRSCKNSIKDQRRVLHQTNDHHALWSTTKTTPKATWGYSPVPHSSTRRRRQGHCGWGGEWRRGLWRQKSHPSSDAQKKSGQDQCSANGSQSTTGPADVYSNAGLGWVQNAEKAIKENAEKSYKRNAWLDTRFQLRMIRGPNGRRHRYVPRIRRRRRGLQRGARLPLLAMVLSPLWLRKYKPRVRIRRLD